MKNAGCAPADLPKTFTYALTSYDLFEFWFYMLVTVYLNIEVFRFIAVNLSVSDSQLVASARTLKERQELIKHGLATPFSFDSGESLKKSSSLKLDDTFGSLLDSSKKRTPGKHKKDQNKTTKTTNLKRKSPSPDAEEVYDKLPRLSNDDDNNYQPSSTSEVESEGCIISSVDIFF